MSRTLTSVPTFGSTCISHLLQRCYLPPDRLTSNVCRRFSIWSPAGMDFPAGLSHPKAEEPIVNIGKNSAVYPLGASANSQRSTPSLRFEDCEMVAEDGQAWVVVATSGAGKDILLQVSRNYHCSCQAALISVLLSMHPPPAVVVAARSYQDPPVPSSTRRPLPIFDPPAYTARPLQIRLPRLLLTPTQVPNRVHGLLGAIRRGVG